MTTICVFEDSFVNRLRPINLARRASCVTVGAMTLEEMLAELELPMQYHVRKYLRNLTVQQQLTAAHEISGPILYVNASLVPDFKTLMRLRELATSGEQFVALNDQRVTAALCRSDFPAALGEKDGGDLVKHLLDLRLPVIEDEFPILEHSFDVMRWHEKLLSSHLENRLFRGKYNKLADGVFAEDNVEVASHVVFDASAGPILIGKGTRIRPFSYVAGPVFIGEKCLIIDHASIKHGTVLRHTVKAGGELEAVIIESYSNKQHHGFLGHSYIGSWVNLGAGTSNSDLKNTYGDISIEEEGETVPTGLQFLGCVIGDFTKTAINTSIFTGKLIGVSSFLYGFVSTNVPSFTNYARSFGQVTEVGVEVAVKTQNRASQRRNVSMTAVDTQLMHDLFDITRTERQLPGEQLML